MALIRANVIGVDRVNGWVNITPAFAATRPGSSPTQRGTVVRAMTRSGRWPPPLSKVWVDRHSPSHWEVVDTITPVRDVFNEDWNTIADTNPTVFADTLWGEATVGTSGVVQQSPAGTTTTGCADMFTGATINNTETLFKDFASTTVRADQAYWLSASLAVESLATMRVDLGLTDLAGGTYAVWIYDTALSANSQFQDNDGVGTSITITHPTIPVINTFFYVDILFVPGSFVAYWLNGDGPYWSTTGLPPVATQMAPKFEVVTHANATRVLYCDWVRFQTFTDAVPPDLLYS